MQQMADDHVDGMLLAGRICAERVCYGDFGNGFRVIHHPEGSF
jgi:hypothetical protein